MKFREHRIDPISGNRVEDVASAPFLVEGFGAQALKIYFESRENRDEFAGGAVRAPQFTLIEGGMDESSEDTPRQ